MYFIKQMVIVSFIHTFDVHTVKLFHPNRAEMNLRLLSPLGKDFLDQVLILLTRCTCTSQQLGYERLYPYVDFTIVGL